ncbi:MAG: ABC transporter substrate-binding protein [Chloroflexi bacterium]|nr:ABC transporter substrate-binding protein [Chloroflexota bacterium]
MFIRAQTDDPPNFDLYSNSTTAMQQLTWAAYNNLVIFDPYDSTKIMPDLAERWDIGSDGKEMTFYLRKGVKFHNGAEFTAEDAKFSLDWIRQPPRGFISTRRDNLRPVQSVDIVDKYTVKLRLERPYAALLPMLAQGWMPMYNKEYALAQGGDFMKKTMMGTGAFRFKDYVRGTSYEIEKTPDYWQPGVPYLDGAKMFFIPDANTRKAAFRTKQVDHYSPAQRDVAEIESLASEGGLTIHRGSGVGWSTVNLNTDRKPFNDLRVRQAISLAIDRRGYIQAIDFGAGRLGGYVPPVSPYALPESELVKLPGYGPDVEANRQEARRLLAEAGFPNGFKTTFTQRKGSDDLAIYVQDQMKRVGIEATIGILDSGPAYDAAVQREFDILPWGHGLALDDPDAHYTELYLCGAPRSYSGLCDDKVEELFLKQSVELDPEKRKRLVWDLERYAVPQVIKIVLSWNDFRQAVWDHVRGWKAESPGYNVAHWKHVWMSNPPSR